MTPKERRDLLQSVRGQLTGMDSALRNELRQAIYLPVGWFSRYEEIRRRAGLVLERAVDHSVPGDFLVRDPRSKEVLIGRATFMQMVQGLLEYVDSSVRDDVESLPNNSPLRDWRQKDISFVSSMGLRKILEENLGELSTLDPEHSPKAVAVICGAIVEGLLIDALHDVNQGAGLAAKSTALTTAAAGTHRVAKTPDLTDRKWTLTALIEVARELTLVTPGTALLLAPVIKEFRNLIHPAVELREGYKVRSHEAEGALALLGALLADLTPAP